MGQKVNPTSFRLKINKTWSSTWFASTGKMGDLVIEDKQIRDFLTKKLPESGILKFQISRSSTKVVVDINTAKPGVVIGRQGAQIDELKIALDNKFRKDFELNVKEIKRPDIESEIIAENIARSIENRIPYKRVIKQAIGRAVESGVKGVKIYIGGRLNGAEMARGEYYKEGNIPLHTLNSDISYSRNTANTTYGALGIKVWTYKGDVFKKNGQK